MTRRIICLFLFSLVLAASPVIGMENQGEAARFPPLASSIQVPEPLDFCGEPVPLNIQEVRERLEKDLMLILWDRAQVILWIKRSARYLPYIASELKKAGLPEDLKYVPVIESALRPHAGSSKSAIGFWQFIAATGRKYGLTIDARVDERRNIFKSTPAAIRYLKELHETLGSWTLAAAAYNMGEKGLEAEILAQENNSYYQLYLPLETQRYVFRILSAKLILSDPEAYGFHLEPEDHYAPLRYDLVEIDCRKDTPVLLVAKAARTHFKQIKDLNPDIRGHYIARGKHWVMIPEGTADGFQGRYKKLVSDWMEERDKRLYVVQRGDNLTAIAKRFDVPLQALLIWNRIDMNQPIHPGDRLVIYPGSDAEGK
jgi:membrane-bound lytic murein transglycosylase D